MIKRKDSITTVFRKLKPDIIKTNGAIAEKVAYLGKKNVPTTRRDI